MSNKKNTFVFAGSSNPLLAKRLARQLQISFGRVALSRFPNGEARVWIKEKNLNGTAVLLQSFSYPPDEHILEFCLLADALKRMGVKKLIAVVPFLGYSKQDKVFRPGEPLSAKVVARLIQTTSFARLITFDLHNQAIVGFFDKPVLQLSATPLFIDYFLPLSRQNLVVVAPDAGAVKTCRRFADQLGVPVVYLDKQRDLTTGRVKIISSNGTVSGLKTLIVDDMIVTGETLIKTARWLKKHGAEKIFVAATHHLQLPGVQQKLEKSPITQIVTTDTISPPARQKFAKLKIISVASLLAEAVKKL